jgi:hypothetical protein
MDNAPSARAPTSPGVRAVISAQDFDQENEALNDSNPKDKEFDKIGFESLYSLRA